MIYTETIEIGGKQYDRTYSDTYTITRDGVEYTEAVDPMGRGRTYTESDNLLEPSETDEATETDYQNALREMGVDL
jgi:hypothetical protein